MRRGRERCHAGWIEDWRRMEERACAVGSVVLWLAVAVLVAGSEGSRKIL